MVLICFAYGFLIEPYRFVVRQVAISTPHWTGEPIRVGLVSDIHVGGRHVYAERIAKVVRAMNAEAPDIILLAGDYTSGSVRRDLRSDLENAKIDAGHAELEKLSAPFGVYAVLGNHDYLYGEKTIQARFAASDITFIDNQAKVFDDQFCLFGFADDWYGKPNLDGRDRCPQTLPMIGLMHNPDSFELARGGEALMVAGHTHGGQINLPIFGRVATATRGRRKLAYGEMRVNGSPAFVTAGIGMSMLSARFRAPPEIVIITLTSS